MEFFEKFYERHETPEEPPALKRMERPEREAAPEVPDVPAGGIEIWIDKAAGFYKAGVSEAVLAEIRKALTFKNPAYIRYQRYGSSALEPPPENVTAYYETETEMYIARGWTRHLISCFHRNRVQPVLKDRSVGFKPVSIKFDGDGFIGEDVFDKACQKRFGAIGGLGDAAKMNLAAGMIARRGQPTLVVVKRRNQLYQWKAALLRMTGLKAENIGLVGDRHEEVDRFVVIGIDRSLYRHIPEMADRIGFVVVDGCDAANLKIFYRIVWHLSAKYMLGLARFSRRADGLTPMMTAFLGDLMVVSGAAEPALDPPMLVQRPTGLTFKYNDNYAEMVAAMIEDPGRNGMILSDILLDAGDDKNSVCVVSLRVDHLEVLARELEKNYKTVGVIHGRTGKEEQKEILEKFAAGDIQILMTTNKSIPTPDLVRANRVFVAMPFKYRETAASIVAILEDGGRILEYVDNFPQALNSFAARKAIYKKLGVKVD